MNFLES